MVALGHATIDYLGRVPRVVTLDGPGEELTEFAVDGGGMSATAVVAAQRCGGSTALIALVGDDMNGRLVLERLAREGVQTDLIRVVPGEPTQTSIILVDSGDGRRGIMTHRGPKAELTLTDADRERIASAKVLHVDGHHIRQAIEAATFARAHGVAVSFDACKVRPGIEELISLTDFLVTSETFPMDLLGVADYDEAARRFLGMGPRVVVVTLGRNGSRTWTQRETFSTPAFRVEVVDTTGAGDTFHGAYALGIARGWDPRYRAQFAGACAALKCRQLGGQRAIPHLSELQGFLLANGIGHPS